jgi:hypothetical protein
MGWRRNIDQHLQLVRPLLQLDRSSTLAVCNLTGTQVTQLLLRGDCRSQSSLLHTSCAVASPAV